MKKKLTNRLYKNLSLIRKCQEELIKEYHPADQMRCPMHFCIGQELTPSVLGTLMINEDSLFCHHRSHGYYIAKKGSINAMFAEFYGKSSGVTCGLAGSQELSDSKINFYSGAILSGSFSIALGAAFEKVYNKKKGIAIAVIGDGGMEEGTVFETLNIASLMNLPILFICENNLYSTHTPLKERTLENKMINKVKGFKIQSTFISDNDPENFYVKMHKIVSNIRKKNKPHFVEIMTYRFNGHVGPEGDDHYNYRKKKEIKHWINKDPLNLFVKKNIKKDKNFKKIKLEIDNNNDKIIKNAFEYAKKSNFLKEFKKFNFKGGYKKINKFYDNKISFGTTQDSHGPKPY
jgi:TPP-dependent pyruvate/acetoin dehydrogenase alpha subunit